MTNNNSENLDRIDTGELTIVTPDQVEDVTDESVAGETLVVNAEIAAEAEESSVEDLSTQESDNLSEELNSQEHEIVQLPRIRRSFRGYSVEDIDNFVLPLINSYNELQKARASEAAQMSELIKAAEENKQEIASLQNFVITDEVEKVLHSAHEEAKGIILVAEEEAKHIINKAKNTAKEIIAEAREKNKHASEDIKVRKANVLAKAHERADEIVSKAKAQAEHLVEKTNEELAEAKEYIAARHEVHNKLQDFYKAQSDFLSKRD